MTSAQNSRNERGPNAENAEAHEKTIGCTGDSSTLPPGFIQPGIWEMSPKDLIAAWRLILDAVEDAGHPSVRIALRVDSQCECTHVELRIDSYVFLVCVAGWRPAFQADAQELRAKVDGLWQTSIPAEELADALAFPEITREIVTTDREPLRQSLKKAAAEADALCVSLMSDIENPANWLLPGPGSRIALSGIGYRVAK